jgi:4-hydroxymandelate oxidase
VYGDTSAYARDPALAQYMSDLAGQRGLPWRPEVLAAGLGQTYGEMAERLLPAVVGTDEPVDVLVLAFGVHDIRPGRSTATYLSSVCPGTPNAFAICDQGTLAPLTALRLLHSYAATGATGRGVLVVAEQATLHYPPARPVPLPERHAAVVLLFEVTGDGHWLRRHPTPSTLDGALAADVAELTRGHDDALLVTGPGLLGVPLPAGVKHATGPLGQPHTAAWWELAGAGDGRVLMADSDPDDGALCVAALDVSADPIPAGGPRR